MSNEESLYIGNVLHDNVYVGTYNDERVLIKEYLTNHLSEKEKNHMQTEVLAFYNIMKQIDQLSKLNNRYLVHYLGKIERKSKTLIILEDSPGSSLREYINDVKNGNRLFEEHVLIFKYI